MGRYDARQGSKKESVLDVKHPGRFQVYHKWKCGPTLTTMVPNIFCNPRATTDSKSPITSQVIYAQQLKFLLLLFLSEFLSRNGRCRINHVLQKDDTNCFARRTVRVLR